MDAKSHVIGSKRGKKRKRKKLIFIHTQLSSYIFGQGHIFVPVCHQNKVKMKQSSLI